MTEASLPQSTQETQGKVVDSGNTDNQGRKMVKNDTYEKLVEKYSFQTVLPADSWDLCPCPLELEIVLTPNCSSIT